MLKAFANSRTSSVEPSSTDTPTTSKLSLYFLASPVRIGISSRHGGHHVAQKFKITTLPCHCAVETTLPSRSCTRNGGTGCGLLAKRITESSSSSTKAAISGWTCEFDTGLRFDEFSVSLACVFRV